MTEAIIVAVITATASVVVQLAIAQRTNNIMAYRMCELEKKVTKHNNLVERMTVAEQQIKTTFRLIDDLKGESGHE